MSPAPSRLAARFGSAARVTAKPDSDMDVLYKLDPNRLLGWATLARTSTAASRPSSTQHVLPKIGTGTCSCLRGRSEAVGLTGATCPVVAARARP